ncbi:MAG: thioredoxin family protein [Algibacter sp.]|uniref:thioredoxin family protein n=1 Tax=Algibacter sp. TaxID=1872428 RepID=UPI00260C5C7A|nr:thioredoxin family protein [Algibacter sp.]MDG1728792.1 thioredoxin family protein [Algibacter sp.]MDG2177265.1 thioredoxin family protein [Algibacter sp.]
MTKVIKVLGTGCPKCKTMTGIVQDVVLENNLDATIEKVEDIMEIMKYNVMTTPALVIDDVITIKGRVPNKNEVLELLKANFTIKTNNPDSGCCSQDKCC